MMISSREMTTRCRLAMSNTTRFLNMQISIGKLREEGELMGGTRAAMWSPVKKPSNQRQGVGGGDTKRRSNVNIIHDLKFMPTSLRTVTSSAEHSKKAQWYLYFPLLTCSA